jgi:actin-related protein 3
MAEIMFETFNAKGLHIGVQAVMALVSSSGLGNKLSLTGTVLDSGDGVTHVIPISDGYVIGSCIKHIPLAGSNITSMIGDILQDRKEKFPVEDTKKIAKIIKEKFGYIDEDGNLLAEFQNFDNRKNNATLLKRYEKFVEGVYPNTKEPYKVSIGYERFLGPEMFFHP